MSLDYTCQFTSNRPEKQRASSYLLISQDYLAKGMLFPLHPLKSRTILARLVLNNFLLAFICMQQTEAKCSNLSHPIWVLIRLGSTFSFVSQREPEHDPTLAFKVGKHPPPTRCLLTTLLIINLLKSELLSCFDSTQNNYHYL